MRLDWAGRSLRWKLVFASAFAAATMLALLLVNTTRLLDRTIEDQGRQRIGELVPVLNQALADHVFRRNYAGLQADLQPLVTNAKGALVYLVVLDERGRLFAHAGQVNPAALPPPTGGFDTERAVYHGSLALEVGGQHVGEARFGLSLESLLDARRGVLVQGAMIALAAIVLTVLAFALLGSWLTRDLQRLVQQARRIAAGDYAARAAVASRDEIGQLAGDFNAMADAVRTHMQALREREAVLRSMVDLGADWYWEQDAQFRFRSTPFGALDAVRPDALGRTRWELECTGDIPPERWAEHRARLERHERFQDFEYRTPLADGKLHWVSVSGMPIFDADGSFAGYRGVSKIITARKDAEQRLRTALREKEILLKEIYHRVKNNLQVVTSLLSLQGQRTTDERARALLQDSANRVESIALVHAQLYRSGDLSNIDMREYLPQLVAALAEAHALSGRRVALHVEADGVALGIETAVPLGLIVNELVSNAFKHAFAGDGGGALTVTLRQVDAQHCEFAVADDGRGLPAGFDPTRLRSLGMQLVVSLAEQLEGTLDFGACGSAGTCVRVRFRPEQPERMRLATIL